MGKDQSGDEESFEAGCSNIRITPARASGRGGQIPETLLSGDHPESARWRREQSEKLTHERRPDLLQKAAKE